VTDISFWSASGGRRKFIAVCGKFVAVSRGV